MNLLVGGCFKPLLYLYLSMFIPTFWKMAQFDILEASSISIFRSHTRTPSVVGDRLEPESEFLLYGC